MSRAMFVALGPDELVGLSARRRHALIVRAAQRHLATRSPSTHPYVRLKAGRAHAVVLMLHNRLPDPHQLDIVYVRAEDYLNSSAKQTLDYRCHIE